MTKRLIITLVLASAVAMALPTIAAANFAIHGNYLTNTDACAGCHRAHTSVSTITWQDNNPGGSQAQSALLVSSATRMVDFCYACHDATSQGADTNVQEGVYEGTLYGDNEGMLNGGGVDTFGGTPTTSTHIVDGAAWGAYGGGYYGQGAVGADGQGAEDLGVTTDIVMDCASCHDPHGSSNYRILKSAVFGNTVGGYRPTADPTDPDPDGWVASTEEGWPAGGFRLHTDYPDYVPSYTEARYAKGYDMADGNVENKAKGMSGWCAGCHATYVEEETLYNAGDGYGLATRHKHPVNTELDNYYGPDRESMIVTDQVLPLAHDLAEGGAATPANEGSDWIECLTCHRAHGTSAVMTGWADQTTAEAAASGGDVADFRARSGDGVSALLRLDNRGVCEVCHNK